MPQDSSIPVPALQPPGAGLPLPERWIARLLVGWQAFRATRDSSAALFAQEQEIILRIVRTGNPEDHRRRMLIKRIPGMEDSSRCWSVFMTLDHLRIVNHGTAKLIRLLGRNQKPSRVTGPADVKPSAMVDSSVIDQFESACRQFQNRVSEIPDLRKTPRWPHPWFGPMNAAEWHYFTAFHMRLHRRQIDAIQRTAATLASSSNQ